VTVKSLGDSFKREMRPIIYEIDALMKPDMSSAKLPSPSKAGSSCAAAGCAGCWMETGTGMDG
jgi:hypothetical protein